MVIWIISFCLNKYLGDGEKILWAAYPMRILIMDGQVFG